MSLELLIVDVASLIISGGIAIGIWSKINPNLKPEFYISVIPLVFVFINNICSDWTVSCDWDQPG